jgi:hypothetical protein
LWTPVMVFVSKRFTFVGWGHGQNKAHANRSPNYRTQTA